MIAKNKKGKSFGGCVRYVISDGAELLDADGVLTTNAQEVIRSFAIQRSGRPEIKQPVGHIPLSFAPEDKARMTNNFMVRLAKEYMAEMGIGNTQYIIVRHHNTDNEHVHIIYNRIDNDLKLISVNNDYKRNVKACKVLKDKHGLTYGKGKERVKRPKLKGADKAKYQIYDEITANLSKCGSYAELEKRLRQAGISIQKKYRRGTEESDENVQGVSFKKGNYSFKGSEIDRKFSHANLSKAFDKNREELLSFIMEADVKLVTQKSKVPETVAQSHNVPPQKQPESVAETVQTLAQKAIGSSNPAQSSAKPAKRNPQIRGVELTEEQDKTLRDGGYIFLENMNRKDGTGKFSAYVFLNDDEKRQPFFCSENPDAFVKYGKYEMRQRDKTILESGNLVRAKVKYYGIGSYARPYLWRDKPDDKEYKESWSDPRLPKEEQTNKVENRRRPSARRTSPPTPKKKGPKIG